jgi:hypothetical protein
MANKNYSKIDFSTRSKKRFIQTFFYKTSKVTKNSVLMLCGPDVISHYEDFKIIRTTSNNAALSICEINTKTYIENKKILESIPNLKYNIYNKCISHCKVYRFVDLDFCKCLESTINIIDIVYKKMQALNKKIKKNKHLLITFAINRNGCFSLADDIEALCIIFGIDNDFYKHPDFPNSNIMKHKSLDCMYSTYRDGTPMCTFSYQFV